MFFKDFSRFSDKKDMKEEVRKSAMNSLMKAMIVMYGEENVTRTADGELAVAVGEVNYLDGTSAEVCVTLSPVVKEYEDRELKNGKILYAYERLIEGDEYEEERALRDKFERNKIKKEIEK